MGLDGYLAIAVVLFVPIVTIAYFAIGIWRNASGRQRQIELQEQQNAMLQQFLEQQSTQTKDAQK